MTFLSRLYALALVTALVSHPSQAQTDEEIAAFLTAPAFPLDLAILGDDSLASEAVIGANGGKLSLMNAAGDSFKLTIPEGALLTATTIRAIPITTSARPRDICRHLLHQQEARHENARIPGV